MSIHLATDKRHNNPGHNSSQDVQQELLHRQHLLVRDSEDCPARTVAELGRIANILRQRKKKEKKGATPAKHFCDTDQNSLALNNINPVRVCIWK